MAETQGQTEQLQNEEESGIQVDPIRCSRCGRFLGYSIVENAMVLIRCHNCKGWSVVADGALSDLLTSQNIRDIISP